MIRRSEAIKRFLEAKTHSDLAKLYHKGMECQVNVAQDGGDPVEKEFKGKSYRAYTDGLTTWKHFRIPYKADSDPEDNDYEMRFDLEAHVEGIGLTGWNWQERKSYRVGYDFDSIIGHSPNNPNTLTSEELKAVQEAAMSIDWVEIRKSTGGNGWHLYVNLPGIPTSNHGEHKALARAILGKMSSLAAHNFESKVDADGGNMWIWHRKMKGTDGLELVKPGRVLTEEEIPINWRDHIDVVKRKRKKIKISSIKEPESVEELAAQSLHTKLDEGHSRLIKYLEEKQAVGWWSADHHMLVSHTWWLKEAHRDLNMRGIFDTISEGQDLNTQNCFLFPDKRGSWSVRRYTRGIAETPNWDQDGAGWTRCFLNREPELPVACRSFTGTELEKGGFDFQVADNAVKAAQAVGVQIQLPPDLMKRRTVLKQHRDGRLVVKVQRDPQDNPSPMIGWTPENKEWVRIYSTPVKPPSTPEVSQFDDFVRHLVAENGQDAGWMLQAEGKWQQEPLTHIKLALKAQGLSAKDTDITVGSATMKPWIIVNKPFQPEYPGGRQWNHNAAQIKPSIKDEKEVLNYPTWVKILDHCGKNLDAVIKEHPWCKVNGVHTGRDYLKCWIASMFQKPEEPLPWLFFYGPQNSGKSILHEAVSLLLTSGYMRADAAITSPGSFNEELKNAVLCVVEETDLRRNTTAYNRIKDWTNSKWILLHGKGKTPYLIINTMHWMQCANDANYCPMFPGDTRITMIHVSSLDPLELIPKRKLIERLKKEASDFITEILNLEIPESNDRFNVPVIETPDKFNLQASNRTQLEMFLDEHCYEAPGSMIKFSTLYDKFIQWCDPSELSKWSKIKVGRNIPPQFPKARIHTDGQYYLGNIWWKGVQEETTNKKPFVAVDNYLEQPE